MRVFPVRGNFMERHGKIILRRRVIHRSHGEQTLRAPLASVNNSGIAISQLRSGWYCYRAKYSCVLKGTLDFHRPVRTVPFPHHSPAQCAGLISTVAPRPPLFTHYSHASHASHPGKSSAPSPDPFVIRHCSHPATQRRRRGIFVVPGPKTNPSSVQERNQPHMFKAKHNIQIHPSAC
jgi:hypothetical protein